MITNRQLSAAVIIAVSLTMTGCGYTQLRAKHHYPMERIEVVGASVAQIGGAIKRGAENARSKHLTNTSVKEVGERTLEVTMSKGSRAVVTVLIRYNERAYSISDQYISPWFTTAGGSIHRLYNFMLDELKRSIDSEISMLLSVTPDQEPKSQEDVVAETPSSKKDADRLIELGELYREGLITKEEFETQKAKLME